MYPSSWISFRSLGPCWQPSAQRFAKCSSKKASAREGRLHLAPLRQLHQAHPGGEAISADSRPPHDVWLTV